MDTIPVYSMSASYFESQPSKAEIEWKIEGYPSWFEVDLDNLCFNLEQVRQHVGVEVMPVVKNNAYGHGLLPVTAYLTLKGVKIVMVAKFAEALRIKEAGLECDVLNMGPVFSRSDYRRLVQKGIIQTVYTRKVAERLSEASREMGEVTKVFVKVDTGLRRVGVDHVDAPDFFEYLSGLRGVEVVGIYSTLMQRPKQDRVQLERLLAVEEELRSRGLDSGVRSIASSDAIYHMPEGRLDLVRPGIALYGIYAEGKDREAGVELRQALSYKARLEHVKWVEKGESITYFGSYVAPERMKVGTIHVGFYDGIPREMSNKARIMVDGKFRTSIGSVSLNHTLLDLRGTEARVGDTVEVIGRTGENTVAAISETAGWMVYSLLNHLNPMIPRVYYEVGAPIALLET